MLHVLNRELAGDLASDRFAHVARWDADQQWIEVHLRAEGNQHARLAAIDLELDQLLTDAAGDFAVSLARKA